MHPQTKYYVKKFIVDHFFVCDHDFEIKHYMEDSEEIIKITFYRGLIPEKFQEESYDVIGPNKEKWKENTYKRSEVFDKIKNWY